MPAAAAFYAGLKRADRYAILHRLITAKKPENEIVGLPRREVLSRVIVVQGLVKLFLALAQ